ncbi:MAG: hypothetical protein AB1589_10215 [Cyanobacteriota bacterium]
MAQHDATVLCTIVRSHNGVAYGKKECCTSDVGRWRITLQVLSVSLKA